MAASKIVRTGNLAVLGLTLTCNGATPPSSSGCDGLQAFSAGTSGEAVPPQSAAVNSGLDQVLASPTAIYQRDPASGDEYVAARDANNDPLGATLDTKIGVDSSNHVWQYFTAPPASTTSMTVVLPGGSPTIDNVPVVDGTPKTSLP